MRKFIILSLFCMLSIITFKVSTVSAAPTNNESSEIKFTSKSKPLKTFSISKGLESTDEYTFDSKRIVTGTADAGTKINILIYEYTTNDKDKKNLISSYEAVVGQSGIFNITIDLFVGENIIHLDGTNKDLHSEIDIIINRLDIEIKQELESFLYPEQKLKIF